MTDVYGEVEVVQEISADDRHKDVCDDEFPNVTLGSIVEGKVLGAVGGDGRTVGGLHGICVLFMRPFDVAARYQRAGGAGVDEILDVGFGIRED